MLENAMGFFKVTEDVIDLLRHHLAAVLPVPVRGSEAPHVDPVGAVGVLTPLQMAPKVAIVIRTGRYIVLHVPQCHLQKETNITDVSDDASVVSTQSLANHASIIGILSSMETYAGISGQLISNFLSAL